MLRLELPNEEEERSALPLPKAQNPSGERNLSARMTTKLKKAKPDVGRLTLELEGAC